MKFSIKIDESVVSVTLEGDCEPQILETIKAKIEEFSTDIMPDGKLRRHGLQKLTAEQVLEIRRLHEKHGWGRVRIANKFGLGKTTVERILKRETWRDI